MILLHYRNQCAENSASTPDAEGRLVPTDNEPMRDCLKLRLAND